MYVGLRYFGLQALIQVSTGILPHALSELAFRARPGLLRIAFTLELPELLKTNLVSVGEVAKLGQTFSFPNGPQI